MKELVTAFAACAIAGMALAQGTDSNVVGYNTLVSDGAYSMVGISFTECGSGDLTLDKLIGAFASGDEIQFPFTSGAKVDFVSYYYLTETDDGMPDGWYDGGWMYAGDVVDLPQGDAVWYYSASGLKDVTVAGEVSKKLFNKTFVDPYTMTSSGFPCVFNPNDSKFTWGASSGDEIQIPFTAGAKVDFVSYYYLTETDDGMPNGWYDGGWDAINTTIAVAGQGFWVYSQNGGSMAETSPIAD